MSQVYFIPADSFDFTRELFGFDCEIEEQKETSVDWPEHAIESGANTSDFGVVSPHRYRLQGIITSTPFTGVVSPTRLTDIDNELRRIAAEAQPLVLVSGVWIEEVVIESVRATHSHSGGESLDVQIEVKTIQRPASREVIIPPALLKPKAKPGGTPEPDGGAAASGQEAADGSSEAEARKSVLKKVKDGEFGGSLKDAFAGF